MARRKKEQSGSESQAAVSLPEEAAPAPLSEPAAPAPAPSRWTVLADVRVSLFGHMTNLTSGTVVSVNEYGPEGISRLLEQGVALEPMV